MKTNRGFTLIELLVAMSIVAIIGVIALSGLNAVINQQAIIEERAERWREIQFAIRMITQDLSQIHPRPTREEMGQARRSSVQINPNQFYALEFSRGGWANPVSFPRGTVLRVAYDWEPEESTLVRYHWPVMDRTLQTLPIRNELLTGVENIEISLLDRANEWHYGEWPPPSLTGTVEGIVETPRAIRFRLTLDDYGDIWRTMESGG
jgi:general secretion pathway protein J